MKKLMFAAAIAASAAAFADPINAVAFENGGDYNPNGANSYFYFAGESDSSVVSNDATTASTTKRTEWFKNANNANYLTLDTEGGTLWRSLDTITSTTVGEDTTYGLGAAREVAATGTYLDTLVQFTVTEDEAPSTTADDKLAIWLGVSTNAQGEVTGTNLMVRAKAWSWPGTMYSEPVDFVIADSPVEAGVWYRLTVKAVQSVVDPGQMILPAFQIYIDGTAVAATTPQISTELQALFTQGDGTSSLWLQGMAELASANKLFPTLAQDPSDLTDVTLQGVGFQGTGAVDEIVWTEDNPIPAASTVAFTLTWTAGQVESVSYTIDGTTTSVADLTSGTTTVDVGAGTVVTVAATPAAWYTVSAGTGDVTVADTMTQTITTALAASPAAAGATGLPASVTTAAAKTWADAKNLTPAQIAACTFAEKAYLLNTDLTVEPTFAITAIEEVTGGWKITVEAKSGSNTVNLEAINGTLKVKTGATLEALASAPSTEIQAANLTFDADGKAEITITGTGKNFIKATVE